MRSFTALRNRCLQPSYRSVVSTLTDRAKIESVPTRHRPRDTGARTFGGGREGPTPGMPHFEQASLTTPQMTLTTPQMTFGLNPLVAIPPALFIARKIAPEPTFAAVIHDCNRGQPCRYRNRANMTSLAGHIRRKPSVPLVDEGIRG
jgi:hypothetical protein